MVTLDTVPPDIFIDDPGYLVDISEIEITGRTEPFGAVKLNGSPVTLTHDIFKGIVKVNPGKNTITVESTDLAGNNSIKTRDIYVYHRITMRLTIDNTVIIINDQPQPPLEYPPFILKGRTLVPIRIISEGIGANVEWDATAKTVKVTLGSKT
ncbi:MAG: copper amine oxidase N-terminal domain-containing protein, partial [Candidatus Thorarchaeota archaeon]